MYLCGGKGIYNKTLFQQYVGTNRNRDLSVNSRAQFSSGYSNSSILGGG